MLVRIEITQEDIDAGLAGDCYYCPGALAIGRHLDSYSYVRVGMDRLVFGWNMRVQPYDMTPNSDEYIAWVTGLTSKLPEHPSPDYFFGSHSRRCPKELSAFVHVFDKLGRVNLNPIVFELDIPNDCYIGGGE